MIAGLAGAAGLLCSLAAPAQNADHLGGAKASGRVATIYLKGGDKLFLPVENLELLSRYGSEDTEAQLDKLNQVVEKQQQTIAAQQHQLDAQEKALAAFNDRAGGFVDGELYVFVFDFAVTGGR